MARANLRVLLLACAPGFAGCAVEAVELDDIDDVDEVDVEPRLYGDIHYAADCTPAHRVLIDEGVEWGRIASRSPAFRACIAEAMENYIPCGDEPFSNASLTTQIDRVWAITETSNDLSVACTGASEPHAAQASSQGYGHDEHEALEWGPWITDVLDVQDALTCGQCSICRVCPTCSGCDACGPTGCNQCIAYETCRATGWPWSSLAKTVWHEVSHTHDYRHPTPDDYCNLGNPSYDPNDDSVPYIVGACMEDTIASSADECGEDTRCGPHGRPILEDGDCVCRRDPSADYDPSFGAPVRGDFNNDGIDDITYYGLCGAGSIECWRGHLGTPSGFTSINLGYEMSFGTSQHHSRPVGGDFDNDGYEDDVLYYGWCGNLSHCWLAHLGDGTDLDAVYDFGGGEWFAADDPRSVPVSGDFDNDGFVDDIAYYGRCGSGASCWRVHRSDGSQFAAPANYGAGMDFGGTDENRRPVSGDFDADGFRDDIAYYGNCGGSGCWKVHLGTGTSFVATSFGTSFAFFANDWPTSAPVAGDFDDDGAMDDLAYYGTCTYGLPCWRVRKGNGTPGGSAGNSFNSASVGGTPWFSGHTTSHAPVSGNFSGSGGDSGEVVYWGRCGSGDDCWRQHDLFSGGLTTANFGATMWFPPQP